MDHTLVHFEFPADDPESLASFYADLFGWKVEKTPGPMDYWMLETGPQGEVVNGGMMRRQSPEQMPLMYFQVESVDEYTAKIASLGGQVVMEKHAVPGMGYFAVAADPQRNAFAIWEENREAR
jgi:predicted enzyme related to lactoylglutathione lyase